MRRTYYLLSAITILCLACHKHDDEPVETTNRFEADIDGKHWQADSAGAVSMYISPEYGGSFFQLAGSSSNGQSFHLSTRSEVPSEATFVLQLLSFSVHSDLPNNNGITLNWQTANEVNTDHFDIERSIDGTTFSKAGELKAAGNSSVVLNYEWHEKPPLNSIYYYRLKSVDRDGSATFSKILIITRGLFQYYLSSASDTAYHFGFNGSVVLTSNDTVAKRITGTFQFDYVDDRTGTKHTVRNGKFTSLAY